MSLLKTAQGLVWRSGLMIMLACLSWPAGSDQTTVNQQAIDLAKQMNQQLSNATGDAVLEDVPHFDGTDVPETQLHDHVDIEGHAQAQSLHNETANEMKSGYQNRPKFTIDPATDPLFKRVTDNQAQAQSLTDDYQGCVNVAVGNEDIVDQQDEGFEVQWYENVR